MNIAILQHQKRIRRRTKILVLGLLVWTVGILARLVQLQIISHSRMSEKVLEQSQAEIEVFPERGTIYDKQGNILAQSIPSFTVYYQPSRDESLEDRIRQVLELAKVVALDPKDLARIKDVLPNRTKSVQVKKKLNAETAAEVERLNLKGVFCREETMRVYPQGGLAAHILGGISADDAVKGGVEGKLDAVLRGKKGRQVVWHDKLRREYSFETLDEAKKGYDIVLTVDSTVQYIAEQELARAVQDHGVDWGIVIVTQPATGEILALASWPTYDPNVFPPERADAEANRAVQRLYDPGSTFKIVTASAALESRRVALTELFDCSKGVIESAGSPIRDHKTFGILTFAGVLVNSSNVGTIQIGRRVGPDSLLQTVRAFGFGEKTGVELPAEAGGIVHPLAEWTRRSIDSVSIGYEISVTPLQMLQAMNVIANGGDLVRPRLVRNVMGGFATPSPAPAKLVSAISGETTRLLTEILEKVVKEGTGQAARLPGFTVAGKTGTTQKFDPEAGTYSSSRHIGSFVGFVPAENPALSMIVVLDEPKTDDYYGGQVAAPVFREIAKRTLRYLGVAPRPDPGRAIVAANVRRSDRP